MYDAKYFVRSKLDKGDHPSIFGDSVTDSVVSERSFLKENASNISRLSLVSSRKDADAELAARKLDLEFATALESKEREISQIQAQEALLQVEAKKKEVLLQQ